MSNYSVNDSKRKDLRLNVSDDWLSKLFSKKGPYYARQERLKMNESILQILDKDDTEITEEDRQILKNYTGKGGLGLDGREILTQYFTSYKIIDMIWKKIEAIGFNLNNIKALEPAVGIGNFIGLAPEGIQWDAIDIDPICTRITSLLYPSVNVYTKSFEEHYLNNEYDLVISNVPFSNSRGNGIVKDKPFIRKLHEYFTIASIDKAKPNGLVVLIVPSSIMDSVDGKIREMINKEAELICAYRLPVNAFIQTNAEVVTDIIFLRKRVLGTIDAVKEFKNNLDFLEVGFPEKFQKASRQVQLNKYYMVNEGNILGYLYESKNRYGDYQLYVRGAITDDEVKKVLNGSDSYIPSDAEAIEIEKNTETITIEHTEGDVTPIDGLFNKDGKWYIRNVVKDKYGVINEKGIPVVVPQYIEHKVISILEIAEIARQLREKARYKDIVSVDKLKEKLKDAVNELKKKEPFLFADMTLKNIMSTDPRYYIVKVLFSEPDLFKEKDVLNVNQYKIPLRDNTDIIEVCKYLMLKDKEITVENFSRVYKGGISEEEALKILTESSEVFKKPSIEEVQIHDEIGNIMIMEKRVKPTYELAVDYLSGNIYKKIDYAQREVDRGNKEYLKNIDALKKVIPKPYTINDIRVSVRHKWIDLGIVESFIKDELGYDVNIEYEELGKEYKINFEDIFTHKHEIKEKLRIGDLFFPDWFEKYMNGKEILVKDEEGKKDAIETAKLTKKMEIIDELFQNYLRKTPEVSGPLMEKYNYIFNNWRNKDYSKDKMIIPGVHPDWKFRPNQLEFVNMALSLGCGVCAHKVGAGKTCIIATVNHMLKVTGRANKPIAIVPGKVLKKTLRDIKYGSRGLPPIFPDMKILDVTEYDFHEAMALAAFNEWDLILIPDTWMKRIAISPARELKYVEEELSRLMQSEVKRAKEQGTKRSKMEFEKRMATLEARIAELRNYVRCDGIYFEDLGVDAISLDEAQSIKNLVTSVRGSELGLSATPSQIALDFNFKAKYIMEKNNGHNVFLFTATPVSNSVLEIYGLLKNIAPYTWLERGILSADDFIDFYADVSVTMGINTHNEVGPIRKITGFINIDDLRAIFRKYVDYRPIIDGLEVLDYETLNIVTEMSVGQRIYFNNLLKRLKSIGSDKSDDNVLKILIEGRACSIGEPLVTKCSPNLENSPKVAKCIEIVEKIYREFEGNQIIFLDQYGEANLKGFNYHNFIKDELVKRGIPSSEIVIVNGNENSTRERKLEIQDDFNDGKYRIVIGTSTSIGAGLDLQEKTIASHNIDIPWTPTGIDQRLGRAWRPGNLYKKMININYLTRGSYDAWSSSIVAIKKKWQDQLLLGGIESQNGYLENKADDIWNIERIMAEIIEDPIEKEKLNYKAEMRTLKMEISSIKEQITKQRSELDVLLKEIKERENKIKEYQKDLAAGVKVKLSKMRIEQLTESINKIKEQYESIEKSISSYEEELIKNQNELKVLEAGYEERINKVKDMPIKAPPVVDIDKVIEELKIVNKDVVISTTKTLDLFTIFGEFETTETKASENNVEKPVFLRIKAETIKSKAKKKVEVQQFALDLDSLL